VKSRAIERLLHSYPPAWRARYGAELASLLEENELSLRVRLDVLRSGLTERLRSFGLTGDELPADEQLRAGVLLVLCAWSLFVVAGCAFAKFTEQWQAETPGDARSVGAFNVLLLASEIGTAVVLLGIGLSLSAFVTFLRGGGWPAIRPAILRAASFSAVAIAASGALVLWAHELNSGQRNGGNWFFAVAFVLWSLLIAGSIAAWTAAAVVTARQIPITPARLRLEAEIAWAVTVTMIVMTVAAFVWWGSVASPGSIQMSAITLAMLFATALAVTGSARSLRVIRRAS
jgi:hypothetical protein